jgi:hypothetical protein
MRSALESAKADICASDARDLIAVLSGASTNASTFA